VIEHVETVVMDSEGLSAWIAQDRKILAMFQVFHTMGTDFVIGARRQLAMPRGCLAVHP
jgi:hypothetical protein